MEAQRNREKQRSGSLVQRCLLVQKLSLLLGLW
jgi:hypothetical protein